MLAIDLNQLQTDTTAQQLENLSLLHEVLAVGKQAAELADVALAIRMPEHPATKRTPVSKAAYGSFVIALRKRLHSMQQTKSKLVKILGEVTTDTKCKRLLQLCPEAVGLLERVLFTAQRLSEND